MTGNAEINLHAALLIAMPLATVAVLTFLPRRIPTASELAAAATTAIVVFFGSMTFTAHLFEEPGPWRQSLIGSLCILAVLAWLDVLFWRPCIALILIIVTFGLSFHFESIDPRTGWTVNPSSEGRAATIFLPIVRTEVQKFARQSDNPHTAYPEGWVRDLPFWEQNGFPCDRERVGRKKIGHAWHTWITGLYPWTPIPRDFWYPGGPLLETAAKIELRNRPLDPMPAPLPSSSPVYEPAGP